RFRPSLLRILTAAVGEDDTVRDDGRLGLIHVPRNPRRLERKLVALLYDFECGDGAVRHWTVLDGIFVLWMLRTPERRQNPARSLGILPAGHRSPYAGGGKVDVFVAQQRRAIQRRPMVFAAKVFCIEQPDAAFLARADK